MGEKTPVMQQRSIFPSLSFMKLERGEAVSTYFTDVLVELLRALCGVSCNTPGSRILLQNDDMFEMGFTTPQFIKILLPKMSPRLFPTERITTLPAALPTHDQQCPK